jgi:hypothetical protein
MTHCKEGGISPMKTTRSFGSFTSLIALAAALAGCIPDGDGKDGADAAAPPPKCNIAKICTASCEFGESKPFINGEQTGGMASMAWHDCAFTAPDPKTREYASRAWDHVCFGDQYTITPEMVNMKDGVLCTGDFM